MLVSSRVVITCGGLYITYQLTSVSAATILPSTVTTPLPSGLLSFVCPRCQATVAERFYGPCPGCRAELRSQLGHEARVIERTAFEPAMHVTPNAVAVKE